MKMSLIQGVTIIIAIIIVIIATVQGIKGNKSEEKGGTYETIVPLGLFNLGVFLITASIFRIEVYVIAMYAVSEEKERLSIINYIADSKTDLVLIVSGIVLIILSYLFYKRFINIGGIKLLNIQAYSDNSLQNFEKSEYKLNLTEAEYIDLVETWRITNSRGYQHCDFKDDIKNIINKIREQTLAFKSSSRGYKRAFMGIVPIPFLIYMGSIIPKLKFSEYLEIQNRNSNKLILLDTTGTIKYSPLQIRGDFNNSNKDDEIIIAVSTTAQIGDYNLVQFTNRQIDIRHIYLKEPGHGAIISVDQINNYAETIIEEILSIRRIKHNLKTVHLICASKPSLVFRLGQLIDNNTQLPIIISYQQNQGGQIEYPWGIYINHPQKQGQAVLWDEI
ncbi:SAVED domain-containing protein [Clostridium botulinum]|uniref:SAVED domain-containing protein n=1 Tax=Clostridium botulinum TaxID=1491 RepID=A0A6M0SK99_CLOBO|nr:SAVED domain-containing protein [Clostridium botulinum]